MKSVQDKTAAITGAASGIGRALALQLARRGCSLSLTDVDAAGLAETVRQIERAGALKPVTSCVVDVADRKAVHHWADQVVKDHGAVHLLFNNAGIAQGGTVEATSYETYERVLNINLWGVIYGTKAFLPHLRVSGAGHVVNISSVFGLQSQAGVSAYNTSKFAVRGFTESLRQELDMLRCGVSATCVHPGGIKTNIVKTSQVDDSIKTLYGLEAQSGRETFGSLLHVTPEHAAEVILNGVQRNARRVLIGWDARLLDLAPRLMPGSYQRLNVLLSTTVSQLKQAMG